MKWVLVLSLVCVFGVALVGLAATLSGTWDTDITIDPQQTGFNDTIYLHSVIEVVYTIGDWTFTSGTYINDSEWINQSFAAEGVLGAFSITSDLEFDANVPEMYYWEGSIDVSLAGVSFATVFNLINEDLIIGLRISGVAGDIRVNVAIIFGDPSNDICDLDWIRFVLDVGLPFCCADVNASVAFGCDGGFMGANFAVEELAIPNLPWLTIDASVIFNLGIGKFLVLSPNFDFGDIACFDLDMDVEYTGGYMAPRLDLTAFTIQGISLECDIGAVTFTGATTFNLENLFLDTYFEYYKIETNDDACCGSFGFDLTFYFLEGGAKLFDVALIETNMELQVSSQFTFNMGLGIDVDSGAFTEWILGFEVAWLQ